MSNGPFFAVLLVCCSGLVQSCRLFFDLPSPINICGNKLCLPKRYQPLASLDTTDQVASFALGYTECSWSVPGGNPVEALSWDSLNLIQRAAANVIGFNYHSWDCWVNHYENYEWEELLDIDFFDEVQSCYATLGWTKDSWDGLDDVPDSSLFSWSYLTAEEQAAAECVCYTESSWDLKQIGNGFDSSFCDVPPADSPINCTAIDVFTNISCVQNRYVPWNFLSSSFLDSLNSILGYTQATWNNFTLIPMIETKSYALLSAEERLFVTNVMDYNEYSWDCYQNHFIDYSWDELSRVYAQGCWETIGFDASRWDGVDEEASADPDTLFWADLTDIQREAANCLCYDESLWDGRTLGVDFNFSFCVDTTL